MGNCSTKLVKCFFCGNVETDNIYIVYIHHKKSKYGNKEICSECYEQKVLEKHKIGKILNDILPNKLEDLNRNSSR